MKTSITYRIRPVTRFVITRETNQVEPDSGAMICRDVKLCETESVAEAMRIADRLAVAEPGAQVESG